MNLSDRIYLGLHIALTLLVCMLRHSVEHWPWYVVWNFCAIAAILFLASQKHKRSWESAHAWLPSLFFVTMFEETSFLALSVRNDWQNGHIVTLESTLFPVVPAAWMHQRAAPWLGEFLQLGYLSFYTFYGVVAGLLWISRTRPQSALAFRRLTDALSIGYLLCYATYLLFPVRSPANTLGVHYFLSGHGGFLQSIVQLIQNHGGVHGNAFPSAHIMLAFVVLVFVYRLWPRLGPWLLCLVLLMCVGAVYDGYHYVSDIAVGALLGLSLGLAMAPRQQRRVVQRAELENRKPSA